MIPARGLHVVSRFVNGTFGEILQGYVSTSHGYEHFLFTAPIEECRCRAHIRTIHDSEQPVAVFPDDRKLALAAFNLLAQELGEATAGHVIELESNIPVAKGHASSTADIMAVADVCLRRFRPGMPSPAARALMLAVARDLEYGDYLLHPGIAACNQRSHRLIKAYRTDLRWMIVGIDEGGFVHTEEFHRDSVEDSAKAAVYERLFLDLDRALQDGDYARCAEIATLSAELHDDKLPKKSLADLRQVRSQTGALGICVAHSGTVAGLIYSRHQPDAQERIAQARALLADMEYQSLLYTLKEAPARGQRSPVV